MTDETKSKGPIIDPGLCRCCRSIKRCRLLTAEYHWTDKKEIYSEMVMDCFGLLLSNLDAENRDCCICATCVVRLRDACAFRQQVLMCEQAFIDAKLEDCQDEHMKMDVSIKTEPVCEETYDDTQHYDDALDDSIETEGIKQKTDADMEGASDLSKRTGKLKKKKITVKRELFTKLHRLKEKLDGMLDTPAPIAKKTKETSKSKKKNITDEVMIYKNAVNIAINSYVCPFLNRISNYYCYYCKDQFTNPNELREHTLSHDPKESFESMMENKKVPKIDITRIDCRLCSAKIDDLETFKKHITSVHGIVLHAISNEFLKFKLTLNNLTCTECGGVFPYFDSLKKHMTEHFGTFICDVCGAGFLEQNSLRTHIKSHNKVEANFPCEICGKNLKSKYSRLMHVATVHEKKPIVNCYKCEESFLSYALRNRHLIEAHGDKRTFPCKLCDKVYNRRKTLMEHNRRNHLKVFRHQCDLCDQKFYLPSRLKEHMATHTGERNFRCEFCDKSYPRLQSLQEHIRSHSNERRYKCDVCNTSFTQNGSLKSHMKSHHQFDMDSF